MLKLKKKKKQNTDSDSWFLCVLSLYLCQRIVKRHWASVGAYDVSWWCWWLSMFISAWRVHSANPKIGGFSWKKRGRRQIPLNTFKWLASLPNRFFLNKKLTWFPAPNDFQKQSCSDWNWQTRYQILCRIDSLFLPYLYQNFIPLQLARDPNLERHPVLGAAPSQ